MATDIHLDPEDSVSLEDRVTANKTSGNADYRVAIVTLPYIPILRTSDCYLRRNTSLSRSMNNTM
jgi:hypothetical protein